MIRAELPQRGTDSQGSGEFGASRGSRTHNGIDYACYPGSAILAPITGTVTKLGYPYADKLEFRYVEITDSYSKLRHRVFYIDPTVEVGDIVVAGKVFIGVSQELPYEGITQHVHYEIKDENNEYIDPEEL